MVRKGVQLFGIVFTKDDREIPLKTILHPFCSVTHGVVGPNINATNTFGVMIYPGQKTTITSSVNNLVICRINRNMGRFSTSSSFPVVLAKRTAKASMPNADGRIILLGSINSVGECVVSRNAVKLGCGLIVVGTPAFSTVIGYLCPPVIANNHPFVVFGSDPKVMMIAMRGSMGFKGFSAIGRMMVGYIHDINAIDILGVGVYFGVVPSALT